MGRLIDISVPVSNDLPTWPGDPSVSLEREGKIIEPDEWGGERATTALQGRYDSYVGRDRAYAETLRQDEETDRQNLEDLFTV